MDTIKNYLIHRVEQLETEKAKMNATIAQNQTEIDAVLAKIKDVQEQMDDAFHIFSPKPQNRRMKQTEIAVLGEKQAELRIIQNSNIRKRQAIEGEQQQVREYIEQLENGDFIARTREDTKSVAHLYEQMKQEQQKFYEFVVKSLENHENKKNEKDFTAIRNYHRNGVNQYNNILSFGGNLDLLVKNMNQKYNNRSGIVLDYTEQPEQGNVVKNKEAQLSVFQRDTLLMLCSNFLEQLLIQLTDTKVIIQVSMEEKIMIITWNLSSNIEVDLEQILKKPVGGTDSPFILSDLLCLHDGLYRNIVTRGQRQIVMRIKL
jgi:hypothetical protein